MLNLRDQNDFYHALENPAAWLAAADSLKWAADHLCWLDPKYRPIDEHPLRMELTFSIPMYRLLLGLSFENILKGLLIALGVEVIEGEKLKNTFATHSIPKLLGQLPPETLSLCEDEHHILEELQRNVEWQGRYPVPKKWNDYKMPGHGSDEYCIEQTLWTKFFNKLLEVGWNLKADGSRIPLRNTSST